MIRKSVFLDCDPHAAFRLFTDRISEWWPPERRHSADPRARLVLEATGRFAEVTPDGQELPLGRVRGWEPPARLLLDFYPGTDAEHPTEVEVSFTPDGAGTRVRVEHRATAASADLFPSRAPRYAASWELCLGNLAARAW